MFLPILILKLKYANSKFCKKVVDSGVVVGSHEPDKSTLFVISCSLNFAHKGTFNNLCLVLLQGTKCFVPVQRVLCQYIELWTITKL